MYNLQQPDLKEVKDKTAKIFKSKAFWEVAGLIVVGCVVGLSVGFVALRYFPSETQAFLQYFKMPEVALPNVNQPSVNVYTSDVSYEQAIIDAAKNVSPSVVSIV